MADNKEILTPIEVTLKLKDQDNAISNLENRVTGVEEKCKSTQDLVISMNKISINVENMLEELKLQSARILKLETKPADDAQYFKRLIIGTIITGVIGFLIGFVLKK
jgi:preprotein translocase subunit Sss1